MDEALWCVTYGVMWWVLLMMRDGPWRGTTSAYNGSGQGNAVDPQGTLIPRIRYRPK